MARGPGCSLCQAWCTHTLTSLPHPMGAAAGGGLPQRRGPGCSLCQACCAHTLTSLPTRWLLPQVEDFRNDVALAEACRTDVDKLCKDVEPGDGRVHKCLRDNRDKLTEACRCGHARGARGTRGGGG
jgi:hypothetical protein